MLRLVNLQPIAYASPIEMVESIVLRVNPNDKSLITLGKLISQLLLGMCGKRKIRAYFME